MRKFRAVPIPHGCSITRRADCTVWPHSFRIVLSLGAVFFLAGCHRNPKIVAAATPPPPPVEMISVPPPSHPTEPLPEEPVIASPELPLVVPPVRRPQPPRRRSTPAAPPTQTAVAAPPPMDLGNLTTGGESTNTALLQETDDLLKTQTRRLAGISTATIALHTQQVEQARLFLKQASDAWTKQDIEGARTLATKAKVILDEVLG
ncbi:hypothetical protein [Terriglobus roseus]|nr:hypothetical protein [Terriglobus roseus]